MANLLVMTLFCNYFGAQGHTLVNHAGFMILHIHNLVNFNMVKKKMLLKMHWKTEYAPCEIRVRRGKITILSYFAVFVTHKKKSAIIILA